jgi:alkylation response protein AidB-like acyl-CoA dehydrogenase
MSQLKSPVSYTTGGNFLLRQTDPASVFTPEDRSAEERQMVETADRFIEKEVLPRMDGLERHEEGLSRRLFTQAGQLGLLSIEMPEEFGGLGLGKRAMIGVAEKFARAGGFGLTCSVHSGIGSGGVLYFGTAEQKRRYLPKLASGEWMAAYCLSEAGSGSDALGMKTRAVLSCDGKHYVLNGTKMWITNSAWADLFTVFAKVDGQKVTAFLVERAFRGLSTGKEEHKLGLKSSSTRRVILEDVHVPVENVLGEVGKGAYIAFNVLNFGRLNFGLSGIGLAEEQLRVAIKYAGERQQFGKPLSSFGLIHKKIADMAAKVFSTETAAYRTAGLIDEVLATGELSETMTPPFPVAIDEFALECSVVKMRGSDAAFEVADESLQIHGGYGYTEEFTPARALRDARLNRIGEGTNEINHLFVPTFLRRRAERGRFPLQERIEAALSRVEDRPAPVGPGLEGALAFLSNAKELVFLLCGIAGKRFWEPTDEDQEIQAAIADLISEIYLGESCVLRALKTKARLGQDGVQTDLALLYVHDAALRMEGAARLVLEACCPPAQLAAYRKIARRRLTTPSQDPVALRRRIARHLFARGSYA